ncbi:porin family protein [Roseateles depolymerans]|uniref:Surface lipoprotein assembly modifier C-terminal domain-containing protein n=1 Tax=Roseateles depolymerans TaxID=76731 RepID=A0A0U3DWR2_9BURK|nr:porin family protein [Roseateles depolymerans]ALV05205.1 hypothetical protein RD2015_709 [Roseateles depolymerans]REG14779.1 tetratricopeptide repeat protein [Roseateles depolymerans]
MRLEKTATRKFARCGQSGVGGIVLAVSLTCCALSATAQDALLDQAAALLSRQEAAAAYALLAPSETQRAGDPRFDYLLGIAALDAGHVTRALFALERVVARRPDDRLARAELGRAYLAAGESGRAREQLDQARAGDTPPEAAAAIDRVLGVMDQVVPRRGARASAYLEVGAGWDSNVNSATHQGEFAIPAFGGILFQTSEDSRRQSALVGQAAGGGLVEWPLSRTWSLIGAANVRRTVNRDVHALDTVLVDTTAGVRHTAGAHSQTVALQGGNAWVGSERYRDVGGVTAQWQTQFNETLQGSVFGQWSRQNFPGEIGRDNDRAVLGLGAARSFERGVTLAYGSLYLVRERTDAAFAAFGHRGQGLRLGLERRLRGDLVLLGEAQYEGRRYGGEEPFFNTSRRDRLTELSVGLRHAVSPRWELTGQLRYTRAGSNVVLYDYVRNTVQVTLHRNFP